MNVLVKHKVIISSGIIWLFHISGIIGITLGYKSWFLEKTPLNLTICLILFALVFPLNSFRKLAVFLSFFAVGMLAEWLGVNFGLLFGEYAYGKNFGPKLDGVPWLIGCFWALLACVTSSMVSGIAISNWGKALLASLLMVLLDFFMERNAPNFDFWEFQGHVPVKNYITWFILGLGMQWVIQRQKFTGNQAISFHLYFAQLIFFLYFVIVEI